MRFFLPFMLLLMAGMVWLALKPGFERTEALAEIARRVAVDGLVIEGAALSGALAAPGSTFQFAEDPRATRLVARAATSFENRGPSVGVFLNFSPSLVAGLVGQEVQMTVEARTARQAPAQVIHVSGHVMNGPTSGWTGFELTDDYREYVITWVLPPPDGRPVLVAVWPDEKGEGGGVDIRRVRIAKVGSPAATSDGTVAPAR